MVEMVQEHAVVALAIIGGLASLALVFLRQGYVSNQNQMAELNTTDKRLVKADLELAARVGRLERALAIWGEHVGAGETQMAEVSAVMQKVSDKLIELQLENTDAHARIVTEYGSRLHVIETQVRGIETQVSEVRRGLPNGEIKEILALLKKLATA